MSRRTLQIIVADRFVVADFPHRCITVVEIFSYIHISHDFCCLHFALFQKAPIFNLSTTMSAVSAPPSPVAAAFPQIQWDSLTSLRLTAQETALLRMAETNPIDYTLADSRDASMYARVLLKLLAEACSEGAGSGKKTHVVVVLVAPLNVNILTLYAFRRGFWVHRKVLR